MAFQKGSQNDRVLKALQSGPKTTAQLQRVCGKYTQRISDLRAAGWVIIAHRNHDNNGYTYTLYGKC
jgi:hypothetical protein